MKKSFVLLLGILALMLTSCPPHNEGALKDIKISPSEVELFEGTTQRLTVICDPKEANLAEYTQEWTSSDITKVTVSENGTIQAITSGEAIITLHVTGGDNIDLTAECKIIVKALHEATFYNAVRWSLGDKYAHPYPFEREDLGVTIDSIYEVKWRLLSTSIYIDGEGYMRGTNGMIVDYNSQHGVSEKYWLCLGRYDIVEDYFVDEANDSTDNVWDKPVPNEIQATRFDADAYVDFFTAIFSGEEVSREDFAIYGSEKDARMKVVLFEEEGGYVLDAGTVKAGGWIFINLDPTHVAFDLLAEGYEFDASVFSNLNYYGLALTEGEDPETGEPALYWDIDDEGRMKLAPMINYTYAKARPTTGGEAPKAIARKEAMRQMQINRDLNLNEKPVNFKQLMK